MTSPRAPFSLQDAWEHVADLYGYIVSLFGSPRALADMRLMLRKKRHDILAWLAPAEALARRLLLLKALQMPAQNAPRAFAATGRLAVAFVDRPAPALEEEAETWRVWFSVWPRGVGKKALRPAPLDAPRTGAIKQNALPLARRLEALRRVLENPEPALKRLSRLLAARREDAPAAFGPYRPPAGPVGAALYEAQEALEAEWNTS